MLYAEHEERRMSEDVTERIRDFYMENPFPDYENVDSIASLMDKSARSVFAKSLNDSIPYGAQILEVGCGTGQMSIFLSLANRRVYATDLCPNSLQLARKFRDRHGLDRVFFYQMNLFRPIFNENMFDLVYCSGVLHHTAFPLKGFLSISRLLKPKGFIIIGLYNKYMRIPTQIRGLLSQIIDISSIEPVMKRLKTDCKKLTWFNDQYRNPHESSHTIHEVISWFNTAGIGFVNSIPASRLGQTNRALMEPFHSIGIGNRFEIFLSQIQALRTFGREGGLFIVIGKKDSRRV